MLAKLVGAVMLIVGGATVIYITYKVILAWTSAQVTKKREIEQLERFQAHPEELPTGKPQNNLPLIDHHLDNAKNNNPHPKD